MRACGCVPPFQLIVRGLTRKLLEPLLWLHKSIRANTCHQSEVGGVVGCAKSHFPWCGRALMCGEGNVLGGCGRDACGGTACAAQPVTAAVTRSAVTRAHLGPLAIREAISLIGPTAVVLSVVSQLLFTVMARQPFANLLRAVQYMSATVLHSNVHVMVTCSCFDNWAYNIMFLTLLSDCYIRSALVQVACMRAHTNQCCLHSRVALIHAVCASTPQGCDRMRPGATCHVHVRTQSSCQGDRADDQGDTHAKQLCCGGRSTVCNLRVHGPSVL